MRLRRLRATILVALMSTLIVFAAPAGTASAAATAPAPPTNLRVAGTHFDGWHSWPVLAWDRSADDHGTGWGVGNYQVDFRAVDPANPFATANEAAYVPPFVTNNVSYGYCLEGRYTVTVRYLRAHGNDHVASVRSEPIEVDLPRWLTGG